MWYSTDYVIFTVFGYPLSYVEFAGTLTGLLSVWLATRSNIWTWPTGLINVACFFLIFYQVHLYADMFLQVYFFVTSIYGWFIWNKKQEQSAITILSKKSRLALGILIVLSTILVGFVVQNIHMILPQVFTNPASYPFCDSFVGVLSVVATILLAQKKLENWFLWILIDVISVVLYAKKNVLFISIEYFIFLCLASAGLWAWLKILKNEKGLSFR